MSFIKVSETETEPERHRHRDREKAKTETMSQRDSFIEYWSPALFLDFVANLLLAI